MIVRTVLALVVSAFFASAVLAAGSPSRSSRPATPVGDYDRAVAAVKSGNYGGALALLEKEVRRNPGNADAWNYLGFARRKLGRFDEALLAYNKALAIAPDHRGANEYLGELYLQTGQIDKARERLKKLDAACFFGCKEYDDLKKAIAAYEKKGK